MVLYFPFSFNPVLVKKFWSFIQCITIELIFLLFYSIKNSFFSLVQYADSLQNFKDLKIFCPFFLHMKKILSHCTKKNVFCAGGLFYTIFRGKSHCFLGTMQR